MFLTLIMTLLCAQPLQAADKGKVTVQQKEESVRSAHLIQGESVVEPSEATQARVEHVQEVPAVDLLQDDLVPAVKLVKVTSEKTDMAQQKTVEVVKIKPACEQKKEATQEAIGIIRIIGKIHETEEIINKIIEFGHDSNVKGILLIVDCGGGAIGSSEILFREIKELSCQKPVVTLVINTCCSGAYWIAIASNWIVAQSASTIGAIGVKFAVEKCKNFKQTDESHTADLDITVICAGKFKGASDERTAPMNDEERAFMQAYVDQQYEIFTAFVAQARNLSLEKVSEWAEGRNFTGIQALKLGLIDQIGGYSDAVKKLEQFIAERGIVVTQKLTFVE